MPLLATLTDTYLRWKATCSDQPQPVPANNCPSIPSDSYSFTIAIVDIFTLQTSTFIHRDANSLSPAIDLVRAGFLSHVLVSPSVAISLCTLEHFRHLRLRKPSFSVEAYVKVICDSYKVPYKRRWRTVLADAFDTYLAILRQVEQRVNAALGRSTPNWRILNSCPPCTYELEDEPLLPFSRMYVLDGGNSAKHMAGLGGCERGDTRTYTESDYIIPRDFVDSFANEVRPCASDSDDADPVVINMDDLTTQVMSSDCSKNWKAAANEEKKRMWSVFDETGIFVSACRHGLLLWVTDMVRSGELAKYPLAIMSNIIDVLGECTLGAYDIGCGFQSTIRASRLGDAFERQKCCMCVDAFHGYTHNYLCQTKNHPNGIVGAGLEDFGTIEHFFSASNAIAPVIRYASSYRRHVFLDLFFKQWDEDKYLNLGTMIYDNYKQALDIVSTESIALDEAKQSLGIQEGDLQTWCQEEIEYFAHLGKETEWDVHAMAYVELLLKLRDAESQAQSASTRFLSTTPKDYQFISFMGTQSYSGDMTATRKLETQRRYSAERLATIQQEVTSMEVKMGIANRWQPSSPEYQATLKYMSNHQYQRALDNLQRLVVQQLFELQRLNISQTGASYKMRTHISKSLQTRCHAIQNAVKTYNTAAAALSPPRPQLDWSKVSHYSFLEEFNLLRDTRQDVREKMWAKPAIRAVIRKWLWINRAKEEIDRCNVEIRRLHTAIIDEDTFFTQCLASLAAEQAIEHVAVYEYCSHRRLINMQVLHRISKIHLLPGFSGLISAGIRKGSRGRTTEDIALSSSNEVEYDDDSAPAVDEVEELTQDIGTLIEYLSDLTLHR
ncbi:uncharacterized protein F5891DRAFT_967298 [Suillus fuscotomentosus]|uniref:CxC1-like cysteine cluster associated with KDZ transposases domain-containing protein n=1 Tax=Suillus fuscotomentosus TaxID=1912939 RepID=A0AAD4DP53_9AGAM|nr:uncharacterized protein F5891DRAFT_967298 [Suillus fuscotomentosus]KAG1887413.1 hypothetical protein F5891DRAFT_967298 [Suillus fuscotomentosus]